MCPKHYAKWKRSVGLGATCDEPECKAPATTRGKCDKHYAAMRRDSGTRSACSVDGCEKGAIAWGYCSSHYYRARNGIDLNAEWRKGGDWGAWTTTSKGYVRRSRTLDGKREYQWQHRWVVEQALGRELRADEEVRHLNGDRSDNRYPENLVVLTSSHKKA